MEVGPTNGRGCDANQDVIGMLEFRNREGLYRHVEGLAFPDNSLHVFGYLIKRHIVKKVQGRANGNYGLSLRVLNLGFSRPPVAILFGVFVHFIRNRMSKIIVNKAGCKQTSDRVIMSQKTNTLKIPDLPVP